MNTRTINIKASEGYAKNIPAIQSDIKTNTPVERSVAIINSLRIILNQNEQNILLESLSVFTKPTIISFLNAHAFNLSWKCPLFSETLMRSDIVLRDGIGMSVMMKVLGRKAGLNMNGTDFIPLITKHFSGKRIALCGTREPYLSVAKEKIEQLGGNVVLIMDGFLSPDEYLGPLQQCAPDMVILGMGMPKQEMVSVLIADYLTHPALIINGGAILDFWANRFKRAPFFWQKLRLEWLYRMLQEPKRLWRRYILGGIYFAAHMFQLFMSGHFKQNA